MKRFFLSVLAVFAIAAVVGCGASNTSSSNTELEGTWTWTAFGETGAFTFSGNQWTLTGTNSSVSLQIGTGTFTIDSAANPKTIDLYFISAVPADSQIVGKTALCIYQLSSNSLTLAIGDPGGTARPTSFSHNTTAMIFNLVKQ